MLRPARWLFRIFLFSIFYFLFSITPAFAQNPSTNPDVPKNLHTYTQNVVIEVMAAAICQITGVDVVNPNQSCLGVDQKTGKTGFSKSANLQNGEVGGAIGLAKDFIVMLYTPPAHTSDYFAYLGQNFGVAKSAYAQSTGFGFQGISPLLPIWSAFRNIVYLAFVVVFVVIGLAIMLRVKIDPRTVMTIENQIPKIIIGIVMVTFSFAMAGFLIDTMYLSTYVAGNMIASGHKPLEGVTGRIVQLDNPWDAAGIIVSQDVKGDANAKGGLKDVAWITSEKIGQFIVPVFNNVPGGIVIAVLGGAIGSFIARAPGVSSGFAKLGDLLGTALSFVPVAGPIGGKLVGQTAGRVLAGLLVGGVVATGASALTDPGRVAGFVTSIIAFFIIAVALLWALFRLAFELIKAYVYLLVDIVFAPFWIVGGLIPGSPLSLGAWIREFVSNLSVFTVTIVMFMLGKVFIDVFSTQGARPFVPPMVANPADGSALGAFIALGIILITPQVVAMMKEVLKAPQFKYSAAIGQAVGVGAAMPAQSTKAVGTTFIYGRHYGTGGIIRNILTGSPYLYDPTVKPPPTRESPSVG